MLKSPHHPYRLYPGHTYSYSFTVSINTEK